MSCKINHLTAKECGIPNVAGLNLVWAIPTHDIESITRTVVEGKVTDFSAITLKSGKFFKDVTASKTQAKHSFTEEGDDPEDVTYSNMIDLATSYLNKAKRLAVQSLQSVELTFLYRDNNDQIVLVGDEKRGLYRSTFDGGTGSQKDGKNGATMIFTGKSMPNVGLDYVGSDMSALMPLLDGWVPPIPAP
jgi:hypothetical protein